MLHLTIFDGYGKKKTGMVYPDPVPGFSTGDIVLSAED